MATSRELVCIIPAAGMSSRIGSRNKLLLPCGPTTLLGYIVSRATRWSDLTVVVTGHESDSVTRAVADFPVSTAYNPLFAEGMASSISCGVRHAGDADFLLIWPGDMPLVTDDTLARLQAGVRPGRIAVPLFKERRGHPVVFSSSFREHLLRLAGDSGARSVLKEHPDLVDEIDVSDEGIFFDVDTADAYAELLRLVETRSEAGGTSGPTDSPRP